MRKLYYKIFRFALNEKNYPFNIWISIFIGFFYTFWFSFLFSILFLNYYLNSEFMEGIRHSFAFSIIVTVFRIISIFNPLELAKILCITLKKVAYYIVLKFIRLIKK